MPDSDRLQRLDAYLKVIDENVRTSRRASEVFFDMPPLTVAVEGERLVRGDLDETYADFVKPGERDIDNEQSFSSIQESYWSQAQHVGEISGAYPNATLADYFVVDTERSEAAIRASIREKYEPVSPPVLLLDAIERYADALDLDIMTAARIATKHLQLQLPFMKTRAQELIVEEGVDEVDATNRVFQDFVEVSVQAHILKVKESGDENVLHGFINKVLPPDAADLIDDAPPLRLSAYDATGLTRVYKLERRPYSDEELKLANQLAQDSLMQATLITFQMAIVDYSKDYLETHPERAGHSLLPYSEFFVPTEHGFSPNPKLLKVLCNNYLPAVAGLMQERGIGIDEITGELLAEAAQSAKKRRVFFAQIGKFNNLDPETDTVELDAFVSRTCPGMQILSNGLSTWMPKVYDHLEKLANPPIFD